MEGLCLHHCSSDSLAMGGRRNDDDVGSLAFQLRQVMLQNHDPEWDAPSDSLADRSLYGMEPEEDMEVDPTKDPVLSYISNMLMEEEETDDKTCMFIDCSGYQAVAKELTDLISDSSSSLHATSSDGSDYSPVENNGDVQWADGCFNSSDATTPDLIYAPPYEASDCDAVNGDFYEGRFEIPGSLQTELSKQRSDRDKDLKAAEAEEKESFELRSLLVDCAQAIAADKMDKAYKIVNGIRDRVSPHGTGTQRLVYYFAEALVARITGTGGLLYSALTCNRPPVNEMLKAFRIYTSYCPNVRIAHFFSNQTILNAAAGAKRLHVIDYGILYGFQWPYLIKALSQRSGGPPHLRITGIEFPQPGFKPAERVEETGRRLAEYAKEMGVPFEYHAIASKWEAVQPSSLFLRHDEVLIVNCSFRLRHLMDETVMADCARKVVLSKIKSMNPKVFIQSVLNGKYSAPLFTNRFQDATDHYRMVFEILASVVPSQHSSERHLIEQHIKGREILNIVSCEGLERVERAESYKQWQSRTCKAGFQQLPLNPQLYEKAELMMASYHKGFTLGQDGKWLLIGWKGTFSHAMCTWQPVHR